MTIRWSMRAAGATLSGACRRRRRSTRWLSRCAARPFGFGIWSGSTPAPPRHCSPCRCPIFTSRLDHLDAETFLRDINFPEAARHLAFEVFSRSFFAEPADLSAAELATMFHIYFLGSSEGLIFDVANANFDVALWNPLRGYLESSGVRIHTGVSVTAVTRGALVV